MPTLISSQEAIEKLQNFKKRDDEVKEKVSDEESIAIRNASQEVKTRHTLTKYFLIGFFILIIVCFIFVPVYNSHAVHWVKELHEHGLDEQAKNINFLDVEKVLAVIIGALGSSLGFIIGYYYKEKSR
ncbi:hypothetical protein QSZ85_000653 [Escherichia coli]|uniref:hypothetical protein n=1 Tax=Escherichia coli TaxID=562 RepID=UPI0019A31ECF|nr:hypothetical protein [Escherichia coli]EHJ7977363.1 hypothetical protein [Escherichia coli]ELD0463207.1 hypothetical protein [Escherichia coli]ELD0488973.1 hypothetical protein [Escherichia coli]ELD0531230.1 hypothetical protein [Escherichia coli]ELE8612771.1 hypothetical protein [Escherichia coli]